MATNRLVLIALILAVTIINPTCQCEKTVGCAETVYSFEMGVRAYPDEDSVNLGDTIWFEISEPVTQVDIISGKTVDYSGAENLGSSLGFEKLDSNQFTIKAANYFDYILIKGKEIPSIDPELFKEYLFAEENRFYLFKLGIVPKESGIYGIIFSGYLHQVLV